MQKLLNNNILLRIKEEDLFKNTIQLSGGLNLIYISDPNDRRAFLNPRFEVAGVPEELTFAKYPVMKIDLDHKIPMEIKVGDWVYIDYTMLIQYLGRVVKTANESQNPTSYKEDGYVYIIAKYRSLLVVERDNGFFPLNGRFICEIQKEETVVSSKLVLPDHLKQKKIEGKLGKAKVVFRGSNASEVYDYRLGKWKKYDFSPIDVGDTIFYENKMEVKVDYTFVSNKELYFIDSCFIYGKLID